jgi:Zn finger protein HypA/HybF involved in hydrogenase expression
MTLQAPNLTVLNRTLDQELAALVRGVSLECLVCGEFVLQVRGAVACPECGSILAEGRDLPEIELPSVEQAG